MEFPRKGHDPLSPTTESKMPTDYDRIAQAIYWIEAHIKEQPRLEDLARMLGLSPFHTQRLFTRWAGVTPERFLEFLTGKVAKQRLGKSQSIPSASYAEGRSGPGRLHDHMVHIDAVTPEEYKLQGKGLTISYGIHPTIFGDCLLALTERGIAHLSFSVNGDSESLVHDLRRRWPHARLQRNMKKTKPYPSRIFSRTVAQHALRSHLFLRGTNFQLKVWEALLRIPAGHFTTYQHIANALGHPKAARAVGNAVGANPVSFLIPCHRVIQNTGAIGNYRWGKVRKKAILAWEAAQHP